ncbi:hypothetical protein PUN28_005012 [Cardiocondyla obscurior]|uniref:Uncharacterized protein n=1 Tax=Cardiocondyla obscurior TaxID=286306 RepID=A0AAW2GHN0_9HYME
MQLLKRCLLRKIYSNLLLTYWQSIPQYTKYLLEKKGRILHISQSHLIFPPLHFSSEVNYDLKIRTGKISLKIDLENLRQPGIRQFVSLKLRKEFCSNPC